MAPQTKTKVVKKRKHTLRARLKLMFKDKLFMGFVLVACGLATASLTLLVLRVRPTDFAVPLRYSTLQGFDALGAWYRVYTFGLFSLLVTVGNLILSAASLDKSRIASFFLIMGTVIINLFTLIVVLTLTLHLKA